MICHKDTNSVSECISCGDWIVDSYGGLKWREKDFPDVWWHHRNGFYEIWKWFIYKTLSKNYWNQSFFGVWVLLWHHINWQWLGLRHCTWLLVLFLVWGMQLRNCVVGIFVLIGSCETNLTYTWTSIWILKVMLKSPGSTRFHVLCHSLTTKVFKQFFPKIPNKMEVNCSIS